MEFSSDPSALDFVIPKSSPAMAPHVCLLTNACDQATQGFMTPQGTRSNISASLTNSSTSALHREKKGKKTPLVCPAVRRSSRLKALHKGFKPKTCFDKNCLACAAVAPKIKKSLW
jgi:hypothetical protein